MQDLGEGALGSWRGLRQEMQSQPREGIPRSLGRGSVEIGLEVSVEGWLMRADPWVTATQRLPGLQQPRGQGFRAMLRIQCPSPVNPSGLATSLPGIPCTLWRTLCFQK